MVEFFNIARLLYFTGHEISVYRKHRDSLHPPQDDSQSRSTEREKLDEKTQKRKKKYTQGKRTEPVALSYATITTEVDLILLLPT
jgi:hypothetical protein